MQLDLNSFALQPDVPDPEVLLCLSCWRLLSFLRSCTASSHICLTSSASEAPFDWWYPSGGVNGRGSSASTVQVTFLKNGTKSLPKLTSKNLKNKRLDDGCLAGSHFWHPQGPLGWCGPCECQKWLPARHLSSCRLFFKFSDMTLGSDFVPFFKQDWKDFQS